MKIDVRSTIAGAGLVAGIFGLVSMMQAPTHLPPFQILGVPTPQQMMRVVEGQPFTVPHGKLFVATGCGFTTQQVPFAGDQMAFEISFSGVNVFALSGRWSANQGLADGDGLSIPPGLVASTGMLVAVDGLWDGDEADLTGVLLGYLADA